MKKLYLNIVLALLTISSSSSINAQVVNAGPDIILPCNTNCSNITASLQGIQGASNYTVASEPYTSAQLPYSAGTPVFFGNTDDQWSGSVTLPFTFNFYCQSFNQVWIGSNGEITFTSSSGYCYFPSYTIPSGNLPNYSIAGFHRDLYAHSYSPTYTTVGTTPNRKFIVNYNNVSWYPLNSGFATFQIVLHETTNIIDVFIAGSSASSVATIGIQQNSTTGLSPTGRNAANFNPVQEGWRFTPGGNTGAPTVQLTTLNGLLVQNGTPVPVGSNYTVNFINLCPTTDTGTYVVEATYACGGTYKDTIKIIKTITPPPTVTSPVNICQNSTAQPLSAQGQNLLWYTVPTGGTGSSTTPTPNTSTYGLDTFWVSQTINGCESVRVPIYINILQQPVVTAGSNSPLCAGSTLLLTSTQITGGTYSWTGPNFFSSSFQNPSIGNAQPMNAGTYTIITTLGGCASVPATVTVVITPSPLISTINFTNATQCNGTGTITLSGLTANTTYTVNFTKNGTPQAPMTITSSGSGQVVITGLGAGTYTNISVSVNGCVSNIVGPITITQPTPPNINYTAVNPSTCGGTNGSITLTGLVNGQSYTINYTKNGVAQAPITQTASGGSVVISNLTAGTYTGISVTAVVTNCNSNVIAQVILSDPNSPSITVGFTNPTVCNTNTGVITLSGLVNGSSYTINYIMNGTAQAPVTQVASGGSVSLTNLGAGSYTGITVTINGCISNVVTATLVDPSGPVIVASGVNPLQCNTSTGSIILNGLVNGITYTIYYTQNGTPQPSFTQVATGGAVTISNLPSGTYTNIYVIVNSCQSNTQGPISLVDPSAPSTPVVTSNSPLCAGQALNLTATSSGTSFNWTGPGGFNSTTQNPTINNVQVNQAGTYSVTATLNGCTSAPASVAVVVNPSPVTPTAGVNNPICQGNSINLTSTTTTPGVVYDWTGPGGYTALNTQNPTIPNATTANNGQYTVIATANGCPSLSATVTVNVTATPSIQYTSSNPTACGSNTGSITLNGLLNGSSYVINYAKNGVPQTALTQVASGGAVMINNLGAGTYSNITVSLNGCPSNIVGPVTLSDPTQPPTPVANSNSPLCAGDVLNLTAGNITNATFSWSGPNTFTSGNQNPTISPVTVAATGTYTVVAVVNGCTSLPGTINVVVNPVPATPAVSTNSPLCAGNTLTLNSNTIPNVTYFWSGPGGFTSSSEDTTIISAQSVQSGLYTLVVNNGNCTATSSANVTVNPIPGLPTVVSPLELCQFEQVQLTAQGQNLQWYTQATGGTASTTVTPPSNIATTMTYYVSQSVNGCEGPRVPLDVTIKPQPQVPTAQQNYNYCQDEPVAVLSATGTNIQWYDVATGGSPLGGVPTLSSSVSGIFHYYVTQTINGCESPRLDITIMVNEKPDLPVVEQMTLCQDDPVPPFNVQGQNLLWYDQATGGTGSASLPQINTSVAGTTDYYVSQTVNGCEGDRSLIRVTINPKVEALFVTDKDTICDSYPLTVTFTGTAPTTADYDWNFSGATVESGTGAGPYTISWNNEGPKTITVTVSNLNCSSTTNKTIYVLPTPDPVFNLVPDACPGDKIRVQAGWDQMEMPGYAWDFSGAQVLEGTGGGPYTLQWNTPGDKVISLSLTNIPCPSLPYTKTISIHLPQASVASVSSDDICTADSVLFTATPGLDYSYQWSPAIFFGKGAESTGLSAWGKVRSNGYVWLTVTDRWGCSATDSVLMSTKSCCEVFLPNVFSPNADGKNDVFRMVTKGHQTIKRFIIMNRWGKIVFDTANQYEAWDGTFNGEPQDIGTYQYYLKYECADNGELIEMKGDVTLVR